MTVLDVLKNALEMAYYNKRCYSGNPQVTIPKAGYEKEWEEQTETIQILEQMIEEEKEKENSGAQSKEKDFIDVLYQDWYMNLVSEPEQLAKITKEMNDYLEKKISEDVTIETISNLNGLCIAAGEEIGFRAGFQAALIYFNMSKGIKINITSFPHFR